jgi:hypothetical protein
MGNITDIVLDVDGAAIRLERHGPASFPVGSSIELSIPDDRIQVLE